MLISIFITVFGVFAGVVTILCIFVQVKNPILISKRDMGFILLWIILIFLGITNLYFVSKCNDNSIKSSNQSNDTQETDIQEISSSNEEYNSEQQSDTNGIDVNLSEEELLIKQNFDLIQQLKAEYSEEDTENINGDSVNLHIYEKAGYMFENLMKTGNCCILSGGPIISAKVIILDYINDEIIYVLNSENNNFIQYSHGNQDKFYCVIFRDDYDIYVTPPIQIVGGEYYEGIPEYQTGIDICLNKKGSKYTSLFRIRLNMRNLNIDESYSVVSNDYFIKLCFKNINSNKQSYFLQKRMPESGIISWEDCTYFSLNTDYIIDISLSHQSDKDSQLAHQTFDGSVANSNVIDLYFDLEDENNTSE